MVMIETMTFEEYKDTEHPAPYVVHLESGSGVGLLYYGSRHSCDRDGRLDHRSGIGERVSGWSTEWRQND